MADETLRLRTSSKDAAEMDRRLLEQLLMLMLIDSLWRKNDKAGSAGDVDGDALKEMAKEGMPIMRSDQSVFSQKRLAVIQQLLDAQFLRLKEEKEEGRTVPSSDTSSSDEQLDNDALAAKKKKRAATAVARKKRYKQNKAAAKHRNTKLMSWLSGGIILLIMMFAFSFITTPIVTLSLIQSSDGSGEGMAPLALPPSPASKSLRQKDLKSKNEASTSTPPDIISPLAAVVPPPVFAPTDVSVSNRHMTSDERASICFDTPNWMDKYGNGCDLYGAFYEPGCPGADAFAGDTGPATMNCCICGGGSGSHSRPPTNSQAITNPPAKSAPSSTYSPSSTPPSSPSISAAPTFHIYTTTTYATTTTDTYATTTTDATTSSSTFYSSGGDSPITSTTISDPIQFCLDTPNWKNVYGKGCNDYKTAEVPGCPKWRSLAGDIGNAAEHCCHCGGGSRICEDFVSKCQKYFDVVGIKDGAVSQICELAEFCSSFFSSTSIAKDTYHEVESAIDVGISQTVGLYNECKCDFWLRLCEDKGVGEACDYAAEYCCGDYRYDDFWGLVYLNSPTCYCDFFNYSQEKFGHKLKPKAMNISKEFPNPCNRFQELRNSFFDGVASEVDMHLLIERPSLEAIYNETDGQNWSNKAGWMNEIDHCKWHGITCDGDGFVMSIDLRDNNLVGQFPVYTDFQKSYWVNAKYGLANLYNLKTLDLADNKLAGTIEYAPLYNLYSLTDFDVSGNQLSGEVDALVTPSLRNVDLSNNRFTSMSRFKKYKQSFRTLRFCDVSNNTIHHDASDLLENIPPNIERFFASNNQIHGSLPDSLNFLSELRRFDMSSNALTGELPDFAESILSLQELDLSNQTIGLTGPVPEEIWRFQSLKILNLSGNKLAGTIPPAIGNMAALEEFDLSNNRLVNAIPSELGQLAGSLKHLRLSNNMFTGSIPSEIGQLQGATVLLKLKENSYYDSSKTAPLVLCKLRNVKEFDLENDTQLCPVERNALSDFYDSTKGAEWTNDTKWLDEYESYCDWHGVTCDEDKTHVTKLELANNGLSGRLRESIGHLTLMGVLDLSDNDIKGLIPTEIGQLSELTYLRLSYNAFTGTAECLEELTKLQLLHLNSNRITEMPNMTQFNKNENMKSAFVTDCGVPSAFNEAPKCEYCTMCCNAKNDCYPTEDTSVEKHLGLNYGSFAAVFFAVLILICGRAALFFGTSTTPSERRPEENDTYALSRIGKESVYSYFVTEKPVGWLTAFATLGIQIGILAFFVIASEANLQKDTTDIQFTWKCPRDSDWCDDKTDLDVYGWVIFSLLMIAFLAKDLINGCKLVYFSSKARHSLGSRIRYFIGGMGLCSIALFAFYVSTVYNKAIATSNTAIIANSVIVLFIMDIDEYIFSAVDAINEKWTEHAADTKVSDMEKEIARQRAQIESQQGEIDSQRKDLRMLREAVEKIQESQTVAVATASDSESAECDGNTGAQHVERVDQNTMPSQVEQKIQELNAASATSSNTTSECTAHESITTHAAESEVLVPTQMQEGGTTNKMKDENALQKDEIVLEKGRPAH